MDLPTDLDGPPRRWLTTAEIVEKHGVHRNTAYWWRKRNLVRYEIVGHTSLHHPGDVEREVARLGQPR